MKSVFEYKDYKRFVSDWIGSRPNEGRGEKSRIAAALKCHLAYVSQVLSGSAQFSMEQAESLSRHMSLNAEETDFFLLLVSYGRAGTQELESYYERQMRQTIERRMVLKNRLQFKKALNVEEQATYYSSWHYAAIHMAVGVPELQTKAALSQYLGIPMKRATEVLAFLVERELVAEKSGRYQRGTVSIHLGIDSPMLSKHHADWRMRAIESLDRDASTDLHYSSVITIGRNDVEKVRAIMVEAIEKIRSVVKDSGDEALYSYAFDLFEAGKPT